MLLQYEIMTFLCSKPIHGSQLTLRKAKVLSGSTRPSKVWLAALLPAYPTPSTLTPLLFLQSAQPIHPSAPFQVVSRHPQGPPLTSFVQSHLGSVTFPETTISEHCKPLSTPYCLLLPSSCSIALTIFQNRMQVAYLFIGLLPIKTRASCGQRSLSLGFTERAWHILCIEWVSVE